MHRELLDDGRRKACTMQLCAALFDDGALLGGRAMRSIEGIETALRSQHLVEAAIELVHRGAELALDLEERRDLSEHAARQDPDLVFELRAAVRQRSE